MAEAMQVPRGNIRYLQDEEATGAQIRQALADLRAQVQDGDRVFIHYSGHGTRFKDPAAGGCVEALLAYDGGASGTITNRELAQLLQPITRKTDKLFVMVDACHSGGVIAANRPVTVEMAEFVSEIFTEVIIAPSYADGAVEVLQRKKNVRILVAEPPARAGAEMRPVSGGLLLQQRDAIDASGDSPKNWTLAAGKPADEKTLADLEFAWRAIRAVKSNAILLADNGATVGVGMGQVNRVDSSHLAVKRAGERAKGAVAASDAFFPFPDGLEVLLEAGVRAVVQPGGSVRDPEVIAKAEEAGITLYLTGTRHFAH